MQRLSALGLLLVFAACGTSHPAGQTASLPGHGAIAVQVIPNPIVAHPVSGNTYDFPFDVAIHETGGRAVTISRVSAEVYGPAGIRLGSESWDSSRINAEGYSTNIPGNGELRYHFDPRKSVPNSELFGGVYAVVRVDAYDETGTPTSARVNVSVKR